MSGSYDLPAAHVTADGYYTNKAPGGVAYRCSFRVTEASYMIERLVQNAAVRDRHGSGRAPQEELHPRRTSSRTSAATGFEYDSGDYHGAMDLALEKVGYEQLRKRAGRGARAGPPDRDRARERSPRSWAPGPHKDYDILGLKMNDGAELRVHPTGKAILKISSQTAGPGARDDVRADRGLRARDPARGHQGACTATRTTRRTAWAPTRRVRRRRSGRPRRWWLATLLRQGEEARRPPARGLRGRRRVRGGPVHRQGRARQGGDDPGRRVRGLHELPRRDGGRARRASPTTTRPTSRSRSARTRWSSRSTRTRACGRCNKMVAVDDCGVRINPMIVEGQIHGRAHARGSGSRRWS